MIARQQLLDEGLVISRIIKVEVRIINRSQRFRLITLTETFIILDITKTKSNHTMDEKNGSHVFASSGTGSNTKCMNLK